MHLTLTNALERGQGVLLLASAPGLRDRIRRAVTLGDLKRLLPGAYVAAAGPLTHELKARALMLADPGAVLIARSAAVAWRWPGIADPESCLASSTLGAHPGYTFTRRVVPRSQLTEWDGLRVTSPALTALDLVGELGGRALDDALRAGVPLAALHEALRESRGRAGNPARRSLLHDSRDCPWSEAERAAHVVLRHAHLDGWVANLPVRRPGGTIAFLDIGFRKQRVGIEIDGREFHESWEQRVRDSARDRDLAALGWVILRFPAIEVFESPEPFLREIRAVLSVR